LEAHTVVTESNHLTDDNYRSQSLPAKPRLAGCLWFLSPLVT